MTEKLLMAALVFPLTVGAVGGFAYAEYVDPHFESAWWRSGARALALHVWRVGAVLSIPIILWIGVLSPPYAILLTFAAVAVSAVIPLVIAGLGWIGHRIGLHGLFDHLKTQDRSARTRELGRMALRFLGILVGSLLLMVALSATYSLLVPPTPAHNASGSST